MNITMDTKTNWTWINL